MNDPSGMLDHSDLVCCGQPMAVMVDNLGYQCSACGWVITQIAFLQNHHGPRAARRARIANKEIGYQGEVTASAAA